MLKRTLALFALALTLAAAGAQALTIDVFHTSDVHGWYFARPARWDKADPDRLMGGFPALAALLEKQTTPYLLLDSGDMFQGTPEGMLSKGMASIELMNLLGYSAAVPGNHDYDNGEAAFRTLVSSAAFPFVGANIYEKKDGGPVPYLKPYVILHKAGKSIAVLGLANMHDSTLTLPANVKDLDFRGEASEAAKWLPEIEKLHPDAVIVITHMGISEDLGTKLVDVSTWTFPAGARSTLAIARAAPGIALVLGGHDHTGLRNGYRDPVSGAWLGESYYGLSYVTRAELNFGDKTGKLAGVSVKLLPLWVDQTGQDPAVLKLVAGYKEQVQAKMGRKVGEAAAELGFSGKGLDNPIGSWLSDVTRKAMGTQLAFQNTHALRHSIPKGAVYLRDLYQAMPFDNTIVTMTLTGAEIAQVFRDNIRNGKSDMQVSGLTVEYRPAPDGSAAEVRLYRDGREISPADRFTVATNSYLAGGGDGGQVFTAAKDKTDTMVLVRDVMIKAFEAGPVRPPAAGRIKEIQPPAAPALSRAYKEGETLKYKLGITYTQDGETRKPAYTTAAVTVMKRPDGTYYESWQWLKRVVGGETKPLPPAAAAFRQQVSMDPAGSPGGLDFSAGPALIEPIADTLGFYADVWMAARKGLKLKKGDRIYVPFGQHASWAAGPTIIGYDCVDFDLRVTAVDKAAGTATLSALHVPPPQGCGKAPAPWMDKPLFATPNNWFQVQKDGDNYDAGAGRETFDDELVLSLADGHIISATQNNPVEEDDRICKDQALADCSAPKRTDILRQLTLTEEK